MSCSATADKKVSYTVLLIENYSGKEINVSLASKNFKQGFGVVVPGKAKGVGFSPLRFGDEASIHYSEDSIDEDEIFTISTKQISEFGKPLDKIIFRYMGDGHWVLVLADKPGHEVIVGE